jgi:RNA polymerase sigma-70 factor (ECF subfamily)
MTSSQPTRPSPSRHPQAAVDWTAALARHDRWLRTVAWSRLRDGEAVEEVMQEVALAAVRQAAPLSDATKVAPWLYRLTVRQTLLARRTLGRRRKLHDRFTDHLRGTPNEAPPDPLAWLLAEERRRMIRMAMEQLPPRDAQILLLKYTENWSYHQIADHLGASRSAVEARLHRARRRLRQALAALDVIEVEK